jgi:predicted transcriptional regulator
MKDLRLLFFELSSEDRLQILKLLMEEPMNVTGLSKQMDLAVQETSRHVARLEKVGLTRKDLEGLHHVTLYGQLVHKILPGLDFISTNRDYFSDHSLGKIPSEYICRLGELRSSTLVDDVVLGFYNVNKMLRSAEEYIWTITDRYVVSHLPLFADAIKRGIQVRNLESPTISPRDLDESLLDSEVKRDIHEGRLDGRLEEKVCDSLDLYLFLSEKEVAAIAFPLESGKLDYIGFRSDDELARNWCVDIFNYYWNRSVERSEVVEELIPWFVKNEEAVAALKAISNSEPVENEAIVAELVKRNTVEDGKITVIGYKVLGRLVGNAE